MNARARILGSLVSTSIGRAIGATAVAAAWLVLPGAPLAAQCPTPDGLNGPCCQLVAGNLPAFPGFGIPGSTICWDDCAALPKVPVRVAVPPPAPTQCGVYSAPISVIDAGTGIPQLGGTMRLDYTRTWLETDPAGLTYQVWRMLAKVELMGLAPPGCPVPACVPNVQPFFYGYVDFARECSTGSWSHVVVLFHNCDLFIHSPVLSSQPGVFHPKTTYAVVAPDTAANPFLPYAVGGGIAPPAGPFVAEAVRNVGPLGAIACVTEEPLLGGALTPLLKACVCSVSFAIDQVVAQDLLGRGTCPDPTGVPSGFLSLDTVSFGLPWLELMTTAIGCWTTPASYPGDECAFVSEGVNIYHDSCAALPPATGNFVQVDYGAQTTRGWTVLPDPAVLLTQNFIDLASNYARPLPGSIPPPFVGMVLPTVHLIYANVP